MTAEEWVGQTIAGKYRVEALLGKGGMGLVLHARHVRLDEQVAIKVLLPAMLEVPGMTTRFLREARAASKIKSRHVARVTDVDVMPDGVPYMVMEYLDGMSFASLRRLRGPLEIADAVRYLLEACDAIGEAHALGIVHRDLKPANLFLARGRDGEEIAKVLDFGISKVDAPGEQDTTQTGQMMGSPKYMAPEQMLSMHDVDARSDVWSLGAMLYDFTAGRPPFVAETTAQLCALVLHSTPPPPRQFRAELPEGLEIAILRCLERDPGQRFADVGELVAALAPFAPPDALIPTSRARTASGVHHTGSWRRAAPSLDADAPKPPAGESPTEIVRGATVSPSVAPPPSRSGTVSVWDAAQPERGSGRRRPRTLAAGAVTALALAALGGFLLGGKRRPPPAVISSASTSSVDAPVETLVPPTANALATPTATPMEPSPEPASSASSVSSSSPPSPRAPVRLVKRAPEPAAAQADPFGGKRR